MAVAVEPSAIWSARAIEWTARSAGEWRGAKSLRLWCGAIRATWASHANLGELARFWLQRHEMFRHLDEVIRSGVEGALEQGM